ncbi:complement component C9 [Menidia menidia]
MGLQVALQLGFYSLCLTLALLDLGEGQILPEPAQINCVWSAWSEWSACDPCTKVRRRSRGIEVFGQFAGDACQGSIGERQACVTTDKCVVPTVAPCPNSDFQCDSGTCIKKRLVCNDDLDCEDQSDEYDCDTLRKPCGESVLMNNEQGRTAGYGINILGSAPRMNPFNNDYFYGRCDRVRNPTSGQYDRLPWNVGVLNYETLVEETFSREIYEDTHSLLKEILHEKTFNIDAGLSFKFSPSEQSNSNLSGSVGAEGGFSRTSMIKNVTEYTKIKNKSFIKIKGTVQLSTYRLRSRELHVNDEFVRHVKELPLEYEKGGYFAFLEDYGTHYTKNGKSGGQYELVYVLNQDTIKEKKMTERKIQECFKAGLTADISIAGGPSIGGHVKPDGCDTKPSSETETQDGKAMVDKVMTSVRGGTVDTAGVMRAKLNIEGVMDINAYKEWARSVGEYPALLNSEPEPIYNLIPLDVPDVNTKISHLKRATQDYLAEYSVCKCKPCQNGGSPALINGNCMCLCAPLFEGLACQNFKSDKANNQGGRPQVNQEGNWSCWAAWSTCSGGKRSRTRSCNTDGLVGASCRGDTRSEDYC